MSQTCFASAPTTGFPDYDQIGRFQLTMILCHMAQTQHQPAIQDFIGTTLLGPQWQPRLQTYIETAQTNLSWLDQKMLAARTKAYCDLHVQASTSNRQDVINLIQHGRTS